MSTKPPTQAIAAPHHVNLNVTLTATAVTRPQLVYQHMHAAALFSRQVEALESQHAGPALGNFFEDIFANASACVTSAAAALEAYANQIFADRGKHFAAHDQKLLDRLWLEWAERHTALDKFQLALELKSAPPLDRGASPAQDIAALFALRNALVHFKPQWSDDRAEHDRLSTRLNTVLQRTPFHGASSPLFPFAWATHASTAWAVKSSIAFVDLMTTELGLDAKLATKFKAFKY